MQSGKRGSWRNYFVGLDQGLCSVGHMMRIIIIIIIIIIIEGRKMKIMIMMELDTVTWFAGSIDQSAILYYYYIIVLYCINIVVIFDVGYVLSSELNHSAGTFTS